MGCYSPFSTALNAPVHKQNPLAASVTIPIRTGFFVSLTVFTRYSHLILWNFQLRDWVATVTHQILWPTEELLNSRFYRTKLLIISVVEIKRICTVLTSVFVISCPLPNNNKLLSTAKSPTRASPFSVEISMLAFSLLPGARYFSPVTGLTVIEIYKVQC